MYERMLVAVDRSEFSDRAVEVARDLARSSGAEVLLVHVKRLVAGRSGEVFDAEEESEVGQLLDKDALRFEELGIPVAVQLRTAEVGRVAQQLLAAADEFGADVIVMGSRGRSELSEMVLGSVAHGVLHHATRRVLVVH